MKSNNESCVSIGPEPELEYFGCCMKTVPSANNDHQSTNQTHRHTNTPKSQTQRRLQQPTEVLSRSAGTGGDLICDASTTECYINCDQAALSGCDYVQCPFDSSNPDACSYCEISCSEQRACDQATINATNCANVIINLSGQ